MRAVGPFFAGVEACPPRPSATSSSEVVPFSVTPMTPSGALTPGKAPPAIAPPSSSTSHGVTPRVAEHLDRLDGAAVPLTSSSQPKDSQTSCAGVCPASSSDSTASQIAGDAALVVEGAAAPDRRPVGSWISPPNGSCCHGASPSTGTTSRWAISTTGRSALAPAQWKQQPVGADDG